MGKMLDNFRAWWNSVADTFGDPGKLAQLSVADLEKAIRKAKEAAAPVIGAPVMLEGRLRDARKTDAELKDKITSLIKMGVQGQVAARKYIERQVEVRKNITSIEEDLAEAKVTSEEWQAKIRVLENELYARREKANRLQADFETARAEQRLGQMMSTADSLSGSDTFSSLEARVNQEKAKAAGLSKMSGLSDRADDDRLLRDAQADELMKEYLDGNNGQV